MQLGYFPPPPSSLQFNICTHEGELPFLSLSLSPWCGPCALQGGFQRMLLQELVSGAQVLQSCIARAEASALSLSRLPRGSPGTSKAQGKLDLHMRVFLECAIYVIYHRHPNLSKGSGQVAYNKNKIRLYQKMPQQFRDRLSCVLPAGPLASSATSDAN